MLSTDSIKTYTYGTSEDIFKKEKIKLRKEDITKEDIKEHYPNQPKVPDYPYQILIIGGS